MRPLVPLVVAIGAIIASGLRLEGQTYDSTMFRALTWRNVTPNRGGRATSGVGVPSNPRVYYMGAAGGGVW